MADKEKMRQMRQHERPKDKRMVSYIDTKMGGPYGVLDGEDLQSSKFAKQSGKNLLKNQDQDK